MADPQIVCVGGPQDSNCTPLPIPPFQPSPRQPPNNVLVIPTRQQGAEGDFCDPNNGRTMVDYAQANYIENTNFKRSQGLDCSGPQRMVVGDCFAEFDGCELRNGIPTGRPCVGTAWRSGFGPRDAAFRVLHDSDPNWDSEVLRGTACPGPPLIIFNPPADQQPPPPPVSGFCDGFGCSLIGGLCVCDPPIPDHLPSHTPFESWGRFLRKLVSGGGGATPVDGPSSGLPLHPPTTPIDQVLPEETELRADEGRDVAAIREEFAQNFLLLDPSRRKGVPWVPKKCACSEQSDDEELLDEVLE